MAASKNPKITKLLKINDEQVIGLFENVVKKWHRAGKIDRFFIHHIHKGNQPLGQKLFEAIAALSVNISFEAVCLRKNQDTGAIEVFMLQRKPDQTFPGQWHVPGSIFRPGEYPADVAQRLAKLEFKTSLAKNFSYITDYFVPEKRGWFLTKVYLVQLKGTPNTEGHWWPVDHLPKKIVPVHKKKIIPAAVAAFLKNKK